MRRDLRRFASRKAPYLALLAAATATALLVTTASAQAAPHVYVGNPGSDNVSQYGMGPGGLLAPLSPPTAAAGRLPGESGGLAVSPDGESVYVTNGADDSISQYDVGRGGRLSPKKPARVAAGGASCDPSAGSCRPHGVAVSPDAQSVYVANQDSDTVSQCGVGVGGLLEPLAPPAVAAGHHPNAVAVSPPFPVTRVTRGPSAVTNDPTPTFGFSSSEPGSTFRCKLDSGPYSACTPPKTTQHLADGTHTFRVRATDPSGNTDPTPATRKFTVRTAFVRVSDTALVVTAAPRARDNLQVTRPSASIFRVTDLPAGPYRGSGVHTGHGCTRSGDYTANCRGEIARIRVAAGAKADQVTNSTGVPSTLYGGGAKDTLLGGWNKDTLIGGPGADSMKGMKGNDLLKARDRTSDTLINCDGGIGTPGHTDKADLDKLSLDPNYRVKGCREKDAALARSTSPTQGREDRPGR
jgi:DNA-binding beta-propeller fold protein YncE